MLELATNHKELAPYINDLGALKGKLIELKNTSIKPLIEELEDIDKSQYSEEEKKSVENLIQTLKTLGSSYTEVNNELTSTDLLSHIDSLKSAYSSVASVIKDYNKNGFLSIDNWKTLISLDPKYRSVLFNEQGQLVLNRDAYIKLGKAQLEQLKIEKMKESIDTLKNLSSEADAIKYLADMQGKYNEVSADFVEQEWKDIAFKMAVKDAEEGTTKFSDALRATFNDWKNYSALVDAASNALETNTDVTLGAKDATEALEEEKKALEGTKKALEDTKSALEDTKSAREEDIQSIEDLIDLTVEMVTKGYENQKEALEDAKESRSDYIDKIRDELKAEQDLNDYRKSLSEKTQAVTNIEQQISALSGNNSASAQKRRLELQKELSKAQSDLNDLTSDHEYEVRDEALEKEQELSDAFYDKQIEKIEEHLDNERALREESMKLFEGRTDGFYNNLRNYMYRYTTMTNAEFQNMWDSAYRAMDKYMSGNHDLIWLMEYLQGDIITLEANIKNTDLALDGVNNQIDTVSQRIDTMSNSIYNYANSINALNTAANNVSLPELEEREKNTYWSYYWHGIDNAFTSKATTREVAAFEIQKKLKINGDNTSIEDIINSLELRHYASGTQKAPRGFAVTDEEGTEAIMRTSKDGTIRWFEGGETVFTHSQTENLRKMASIPNFYEKIFGTSTTPSLGLTALIEQNNENFNKAASLLNPSINNRVINQTNKTDINVNGVLDDNAIDKLYSTFEKRMFERFRQIGNM